MKQRETSLNQIYIGRLISENTKVLFLIAYAFFLFAVAFLFNSPSEILHGQWTILISPANLITDYFALTSVGATFFNSALMVLHAIGIVRLTKAKINGPVIAGVLTVSAFAFFGKNLYNSMPIVLGAFSYAKYVRMPAEKSLLSALFGTALGPLVSEISFNLNLPLALGILLGSTVGFMVGFILPPLANHSVRFTEGYSVYNVGFTSGVVGTIFTSIIRAFGYDIELVSLLAEGYNDSLYPLLIFLFTIMFLVGLIMNSWSLTGYKKLLQRSGKLSTDFIDLDGFRITLINMAFLGYVSLGYVYFHGGELNGPVIGGILTVVGFGAFGKHVKNVLPILIGISLMGILNQYDMSSTAIMIAGLFGTTLAPIAGKYGMLVGMVAGAIHLSVVTNTSFLHGGVNLYNNGFAAGFVAAVLIPLLESIQYHTEERRIQNEPDNPAEEVEKIRDEKSYK
ncbi:DUF1576 domain-containing protein [Lacticigenium naphthae]|uniref:DUF1576 domain-containing protein n=1 Tax=Lacticigenium naphthae TaxID=515351 RepID=UPI0003F56ACF|nr:DUF1576 domain-containing protein [Lacticigenium naphthae]